MTADDVHLYEMAHEPAEAFLDTLRQQMRPTAPPAPSPQLASLMAAHLDLVRGATPAVPRPSIGRTVQMIKQMAHQVGTKVAAATLGAALTLGGMGSTGALTGAMRMILDSSPAPTETATGDCTPAGDDVTTDPADSTDPVLDPAADSELEPVTAPEAEVCDDPAEETGDPAEEDSDADSESAIRTASDCVDGNHGCWVSFAAHNKSTTCANHGKYMSQVARHKGDEGTYVFDTNCDGQLDATEQAAHDDALGAAAPADETAGSATADSADAPTAPTHGKAHTKPSSKAKAKSTSGHGRSAH